MTTPRVDRLPASLGDEIDVQIRSDGATSVGQQKLIASSLNSDQSEPGMRQARRMSARRSRQQHDSQRREERLRGSRAGHIMGDDIWLPSIRKTRWIVDWLDEAGAIGDREQKRNLGCGTARPWRTMDRAAGHINLETRRGHDDTTTWINANTPPFDPAPRKTTSLTPVLGLVRSRRRRRIGVPEADDLQDPEIAVILIMEINWPVPR